MNIINIMNFINILISIYIIIRDNRKEANNAITRK